MNVIRRTVPAKLGEWQWLFGMSCLHIGNAACDERRLRSDLRDAVERNAWVVIIGDVLDAITPRDKRYAPGRVADWCAGSDSQINDAIERAADILKPAAHRILAIGMGNHEETVLRQSGIDIVSILTHRLNCEQLRQRGKPANVIAPCGISAYLLLRPVTYGKVSNISPYTVLWHHGAGGAADATKGIGGVRAKSAHWKYDLLLMGHRHHRWSLCECYVEPGGLAGGVIVREPRVAMCGSYLRSVYDGPRSPGEYPFSESADHAPKPLGGAWVRWRINRLTAGKRPDGSRVNSCVLEQRVEI